MISNPEQYMARAVELAKTAASIGEVPVGAVIVDPQGTIVAEGYNQSIIAHDPSSHAEIVAIRAAGQKIKNYRMPGYSLFVTLEPCCMCTMAMIHARISSLYFGAYDKKTGACGSAFSLSDSPLHNHRMSVTGGILQQECSKMLSDFFKERRSLHKLNKNT
ncbi:MAG: tRNA adenosine(34) deaminase TadA [Succinivibrio sp.]